VLFVVLLAAILVAGATGFLGVKSRTTTVTGREGYQLQVRYAQITRPGTNSPWELTITHAGGFNDKVMVETTSEYVDLFDQVTVNPQPSSETANDQVDRWTFDPPQGDDTMTVSLDATVRPDVELRRTDGYAAVYVGGDDTPVAGIAFRTTVLP